jgi:hypothetical protein
MVSTTRLPNDVAAPDRKHDLLPDPDRFEVSSLSSFGDTRWRLDIHTPGQESTHSCINWAFQVEDNTVFTDPQYASLLYPMKLFVWSLFKDPRNRRRLSGGSAQPVAKGARFLARWMISNDYAAFSELDESACKQYLDDLVLAVTHCLGSGIQGANGLYEPEDVASQEISESAFTPALRILESLWQQSSALVDLGISPIPQHPFGGEFTQTVAGKLATKADGWIEPLPDEIALPVMEAAHRMIGAPANDVLRLQELYLETVSSVSHCCQERQAMIGGRAITQFRFSTVPGDEKPWREPVTKGKILRYSDSKISYPNLDANSQLRRLIELICGAAVVVLQSETGMRINEISGLPAGLSQATGLPLCIEIRQSKTGLHDLFYLKGRHAKFETAPRLVDWLLGARPCGSTEIPAPVCAITILNRLYEPLRTRAEDPTLRHDLLVQGTVQRGYPRDGKRIGKITTSRLLQYQRDFVLTSCDFSTLPERNAAGQDLTIYRKTRGTCLRSHAWRKTFALYMFRVDPRMAPAIAQQFQHLSLAMTDEGYIGNNPLLIEAMDSVRTQQTARFMYEALRGKRTVTGRLAKLIQEHSAELDQLIVGGVVEAKHRIEEWVVEQDLRIWFSPHGKCFIQLSPMQSRCHERAGTLHWANREPNYLHRSPDVCLGCALYAIDGDHAPYWLDRYSEHQSAWDKASAVGVGRDYRVAQYRAEQSAAVLNALGVPLPILGPEIHSNAKAHS